MPVSLSTFHRLDVESDYHGGRSRATLNLFYSNLLIECPRTLNDKVSFTMLTRDVATKWFIIFLSMWRKNLKPEFHGLLACSIDWLNEEIEKCLWKQKSTTGTRKHWKIIFNRLRRCGMQLVWCFSFSRRMWFGLSLRALVLWEHEQLMKGQGRDLCPICT